MGWLNTSAHMTSREQLHSWLTTPLPSKNKQRKKPFKPTRELAYQVFDVLNELVFSSSLTRPAINFRTLHPHSWGECIGFDEDRLYCKFKFDHRFYCIQWFIMILAHEMAHQHQWDVQGPHRRTHKREPLLSHGASFFQFKSAMLALGIPLKTQYNDKHWFKHQQLTKL